MGRLTHCIQLILEKAKQCWQPISLKIVLVQFCVSTTILPKEKTVETVSTEPKEEKKGEHKAFLQVGIVLNFQNTEEKT